MTLNVDHISLLVKLSAGKAGAFQRSTGKQEGLIVRNERLPSGLECERSVLINYLWFLYQWCGNGTSRTFFYSSSRMENGNFSMSNPFQKIEVENSNDFTLARIGSQFNDQTPNFHLRRNIGNWIRRGFKLLHRRRITTNAADSFLRRSSTTTRAKTIFQFVYANDWAVETRNLIKLNAIGS